MSTVKNSWTGPPAAARNKFPFEKCLSKSGEGAGGKGTCFFGTKLLSRLPCSAEMYEKSYKDHRVFSGSL